MYKREVHTYTRRDLPSPCKFWAQAFLRFVEQASKTKKWLAVPESQICWIFYAVATLAISPPSQAAQVDFAWDSQTSPDATPFSGMLHRCITQWYCISTTRAGRPIAADLGCPHHLFWCCCSLSSIINNHLLSTFYVGIVWWLLNQRWEPFLHLKTSSSSSISYPLPSAFYVHSFSWAPRHRLLYYVGQSDYDLCIRHCGAVSIVGGSTHHPSIHWFESIVQNECYCRRYGALGIVCGSTYHQSSIASNPLSETNCRCLLCRPRRLRSLRPPL